MPWLLAESVAKQVEAAISAGMVPTAQQQAEHEAQVLASSGDEKPYHLVGDHAVVSVRGILTSRPSLLARWFGGGNTTYGAIVSAVASADQDPAVAHIDLDIDSPGGEASAGWLDAMLAVQNASKPVHAYVGNMAASAAYGIAAPAEDIVAHNRMSTVGSIGVAARFLVWDDVVDIASSNAPKKRPDVKTDEGKATVREELDAIESIFIEAVAQGRGVSESKVIKHFGQGATVLASEALSRGMIDSIAEPKLRPVKTTQAAASGPTQEETAMDLEELKAKHPAVYQAAKDAGRDEERQRVSAYLTAGELSGDMKTAVGHIKAGDELTMDRQMHFTMVAANRGQQKARNDDDEAAQAALGTAAGSTQADDADAVVTLVEARLGVAAEA